MLKATILALLATFALAEPPIMSVVSKSAWPTLASTSGWETIGG